MTSTSASINIFFFIYKLHIPRLKTDATSAVCGERPPYLKKWSAIVCEENGKQLLDFSVKKYHCWQKQGKKNKPALLREFQFAQKGGCGILAYTSVNCRIRISKNSDDNSSKWNACAKSRTTLGFDSSDAKTSSSQSLPIRNMPISVKCDLLNKSVDISSSSFFSFISSASFNLDMSYTS